MVYAFSANVTPRLSVYEVASWDSSSSRRQPRASRDEAASAQDLGTLFGNNYKELTARHQKEKNPVPTIDVGGTRHEIAQAPTPRLSTSSRSSLQRRHTIYELTTPARPKTSSGERAAQSKPELFSSPSFGSLRPPSNHDSPPEKRRRRFPFSFTSRKELSASTSTTASKASLGLITDDKHRTQSYEPAMAEVPKGLSQAALKRLGIEQDSPHSASQRITPNDREERQERQNHERAMHGRPGRLSPVAPNRFEIKVDSPQGSSRYVAQEDKQERHSPDSEIAELSAGLSSLAMTRLEVDADWISVTAPSLASSPIAKSPSTGQRPAFQRFLTAESVASVASSAGSSVSVATQTSTSPTVRPLSPITGVPRPEHPLEAEARLNRTNRMSSIDEWIGRSTFYSASSDSEEDEDIYSSETSGYASSHTSYGVPTPLETEVIRIFGQDSLDGKLSSSRAGHAQPMPVSHHVHQSSVSSSGSSQNSTSMSSPALRHLSFSRPFSRSSSQSSSNCSQGEISLSRPSSIRSPSQAENSLCRPLEVINEDVVVNGVDLAVNIGGLARQKGFPVTRNFSRSKRSCSSTVPPSPSTRTSTDAFPQPPLSVSTHAVRSGQRPDGGPSSKSELWTEKRCEVTIPVEAAEVVILRIFEALDNFKDLFVCARLTKGFYSVFKKHELRLMKNSLRNMSPAEWELREASPKEIVPALELPSSEYTPIRYVQFHERDHLILQSLKSMMLKRCQTKLRNETITALADPNSSSAAQVNDAFWRIWTFCTIFGVDKWENDLQAQTDWLRGRLRSARPSTSSTAASQTRSGKHKVSSPTFGQGNYGGLTIEELGDIMEIWSALKFLLRGLSRTGRAWQARKYGVFDNQDIAAGNTEAEQVTLDEWIHWVATQGLSTVSDLAADAVFTGPTAFETAQDMGWTTWMSPVNGRSRSNFLEEAISRVRDELTVQCKTSSLSPILVSERRKSRNYELAATVREQERGFELKDNSSLEDKGLGLWVEWMKKFEGKPVPSRPASGFWTQESRTESNPQSPGPEIPVPGTPLSEGPPPIFEQPRKAPKPGLRHRSSNNSLSLFPPQYTKVATPTTSARNSPTTTPLRSRQNSLAKSVESVEAVTRDAVKNGGQEEKQQPTFSPRLSVCPEA